MFAFHKTSATQDLKSYCELAYRGVARIFGKGVLYYAHKILSHAHLLTGKVKV